MLWGAEVCYRSERNDGTKSKLFTSNYVAARDVRLPFLPCNVYQLSLPSYSSFEGDWF